MNRFTREYRQVLFCLPVMFFFLTSSCSSGLKSVEVTNSLPGGGLDQPGNNAANSVVRQVRNVPIISNFCQDERGEASGSSLSAPIYLIGEMNVDFEEEDRYLDPRWRFCHLPDLHKPLVYQGVNEIYGLRVTLDTWADGFNLPGGQGWLQFAIANAAKDSSIDRLGHCRAAIFGGDMQLGERKRICHEEAKSHFSFNNTPTSEDEWGLPLGQNYVFLIDNSQPDVPALTVYTVDAYERQRTGRCLDDLYVKGIADDWDLGIVMTESDCVYQAKVEIASPGVDDFKIALKNWGFECAAQLESPIVDSDPLTVACGLGSQGENFTTEFSEAGTYTFLLDRRSDVASLLISKDP